MHALRDSSLKLHIIELVGFIGSFYISSLHTSIDMDIYDKMFHDSSAPVDEIVAPSLNVEPAVFNATTHDLFPSISPRDTLEYIEDKKQLKAVDKFFDTNKLINKFVILLQSEILKAKPKNILEFIVNEFFSEMNIKRLKSTLL